MPTHKNGSRDRILESIRAGLRTPVPERPNPANDGAIFAPIFAPIDDPLGRFQQECAHNLTECVLTDGSAASAKALVETLQSLPTGEIFFQDAPALRDLLELASLPFREHRSIRWSSDGGPREGSQATVTLTEALIAQTGSVFVTSSCGGRAASVVAPCHIVFATAAQLVPDLHTALANASLHGTLTHNSFACLISGSSRTGDIEKILVLGAHGPRRLIVILQTEG